MAGRGRASRADNLAVELVNQQCNASSSGGPILQSNGCAIAGPLIDANTGCTGWNSACFMSGGTSLIEPSLDMVNIVRVTLGLAVRPYSCRRNTCCCALASLALGVMVFQRSAARAGLLLVCITAAALLRYRNGSSSRCSCSALLCILQ